MHWANTVPPKMIDQWIAYMMVKHEPAKSTSGQKSPDEIRDLLAGRFG